MSGYQMNAVAIDNSASYGNDVCTLGFPAVQNVESLPAAPIKWSWSCRALDKQDHWYVDSRKTFDPQAGDVVLVRVKNIRNHSRIMTINGERLRLYPNDLMICVLGNRYATDAFEGEVQSLKRLYLLTGAGMIGTVLSRNSGTKPPTEVEFLGYLMDRKGNRVNLKSLQYRPPLQTSLPANIIFVIGSGMNSGKTTTVTKLIRGLLDKGLKVAGCKLTGSVSHRDLLELKSTGAQDVRDFSDYGFPSTYLCSREELRGLFNSMLSDAAKSEPDVAVVEVADGLLQRETRMILEDAKIKSHIKGIVLTAACASSAIYGIEQLKNSGYDLVAVSGIITNSPLYIRELSEHCEVPVASSAENSSELADEVVNFLQKKQ